MNLELVPYKKYESELPQNGQHILGQLRGNNIIVYQAFNPEISEFAVRNQKFGGSSYSFSRMSWIKPNFLWMMYRAGWASKPNQECILAIEIGLDKLELILEKAVYSSFQPDVYPDKSSWENDINSSEVRLQWDPDHDPKGNKLNRRAMQLGMKGKILKQFATEWIVSIEDISSFVKKQGELVVNYDLENLVVVKEQVISIQNNETIKKIKIDI